MIFLLILLLLLSLFIYLYLIRWQTNEIRILSFYRYGKRLCVIVQLIQVPHQTVSKQNQEIHEDCQERDQQVRRIKNAGKISKNQHIVT